MLRWVVRYGFYSFAAIAFVASLGVLVVRYKAVEAEQGARVGPGVGGAGDGAPGKDDATKAAEFVAETRRLLNTSVPLVLTRRAVRSTRPFSCGGSHVVKLRSYADLKKIPRLADLLPSADPYVRPGEPTWRRFATCAVVGNSGSLLETQFGEDIDAHEVVFRFNAGKTEGYEQFVGYKTTFRILNSPDAKAPFGGELRVTTLRNQDFRDWAKLVSADAEVAKLSLATDPEVLCHAWSWIKQRGDKPSSGLVGVVLALRMCESVDMYGFQSQNYFSKFSRPHYYDWERPQKGRERVHPFTREVSLYANLAKHGFITIH